MLQSCPFRSGTPAAIRAGATRAVSPGRPGQRCGRAAPYGRPQVLGERRVALLDLPEIALEQRDQAHRGDRDDGGGAAARREERDLAEHISRDEAGDPLVATEHIGASLLHREERVAEVAFGRKHGSRVDLELAREPGDDGEIGVLELREERELRMRSGLTGTDGT